MNNNLRAFVWMIGGIFSFSTMAVAGRIVQADLSAMQLMFYRNVIACTVLLCILPYIGNGRFKIRQPYTHLVRHVIHFFGQYAWFLAISLIPLAQVFALEFTVPIWSLIVAALLLSEKISMPRLVAVALGFLGTLVIVRPGFAELETGTLIMLGGAVAFGFAHTLTRKITLTDSPLSVMVLMHFVQLPMSLVGFLFAPSWPPADQWPCLAAIALLAMTGHFCLSKALSLAPANIVIPIDFLRLPVIAVMAWLIFQEPIDEWVFAGAALMFAGVAFNLWSGNESRR